MGREALVMVNTRKRFLFLRFCARSFTLTSAQNFVIVCMELRTFSILPQLGERPSVTDLSRPVGVAASAIGRPVRRKEDL